jgi:DNA primase catalytic core
MAIAQSDIERVKQTTDLAAVIRARGVALKRQGKQLVGRCPFHDDKTPSLIVDSTKQLWNCLGACQTGGDVFSFVMKADGLGFAEAFAAVAGQTSNVKSPAAKPHAEETAADEPMSKTELEYLAKAVAYYRKALAKHGPALEYLARRGVSVEALRVFQVGYVDGSLKDKLNPNGKAALRRVGLLNDKGHETMFGCVVFPLLDANTGQPVGLYARHVEKKQHLYLSGTRRGVFNPAGAKEADEVILTESVIDAAALWSVGVRNVTCAYGVNGLTSDILNHLAESRARRVALLLDADEAGRAAVPKFAAKLQTIGIEARAAWLPAKDAAEFVAAGGDAETVRGLLANAETVQAATGGMSDGDGAAATQEKGATLLSSLVAAGPSEAAKEETDGAAGLATGDGADNTLPTLATLPDGARVMAFGNREYRVRGLSPVGLERLKVNLRLNVGPRFHLDTLDLYQARARQTFAQTGAKLCGVNEAQLNADLLALIEGLEAARLEMRKQKPATENGAAMSETERQAALSFLQDPRLCERIVEDFRRCGLVGERATVLTAYLGAVSRKLNEPLALLIVARSGAGKSALQDALCAFVPPEELVRVTRLTGQALFYKDPYSLQRKLLVIAEEEGAQQAVYSLRTLASDQRLSIAATRTDPNTGKLSTEHYEVFGPVVIVITTTSAEAFDEETRSRFVLLSLNESIEQTRAILERQRRNYSLSGVLEQAEAEAIRATHHHAQRLLKPLAVANPFVEYLTYPAERLIHRREQRKYLSLINAVALLHQHQREVKTAQRGAVEIEYVEVELSDIALANGLAETVLGVALDELAPPVRGMFAALTQACRQKAEELNIKAADVQLTRRDIRELTAWSDWQVRMYCQKLVEMEYLYATPAVNGKASVYQLARAEESPAHTLRGLST